MSFPRSFLLLSVGAVLLTSCKHERALTAEELQIAQRAMRVEEVSLMLRGGYKQNAIIAEIQKRHVTQKLNAKAEEQLRRSGATQALIDALQDKKNILSAAQFEAHENFVAETAARTHSEFVARQNETNEQQSLEEQDRQRKQALFNQSVQNARYKEYRENAYQQADANYNARKRSLESQIAAQENYINRLRSNGYREVDLVAANATLDRYRQQLASLSPPPLR